MVYASEERKKISYQNSKLPAKKRGTTAIQFPPKKKPLRRAIV